MTDHFYYATDYFYYAVVACAPRMMRGYLVAAVEVGGNELIIERVYGGRIVGRFDTYLEASEYAASMRNANP